MEIKVGIENVARELVVESDTSAAKVVQAFDKALSDGGIFELLDERGRRVLIPVAKVAYLDLGEENARHVGFSTS